MYIVYRPINNEGVFMPNENQQNDAMKIQNQKLLYILYEEYMINIKLKEENERLKKQILKKQTRPVLRI